MPTDAKLFAKSFCFVFIRFLGNEVFDQSGLVVSVERQKVGKVKFFKNLPEECPDCPPLCTVAMRLRTSHVS